MEVTRSPEQYRALNQREVEALTPAEFIQWEKSSNVIIGSLTWDPHHGYSDTTTWIDAKLTDNSNGATILELDIGSTSDECCVNEDNSKRAQELWHAGSVLAYRPYPKSPLSLLVPVPLTYENITKALLRFYP
jgi:hypothetical protein